MPNTNFGGIGLTIKFSNTDDDKDCILYRFSMEINT